MAMNGRKWLSFQKDNSASVSPWYRLGFMLPSPRKSFKDPRTKISTLPSLVEGRMSLQTWGLPSHRSVASIIWELALYDGGEPVEEKDYSR